MTLPLLLLMTFLISTQHKLLQSVLGKDLVDTLAVYLVSSIKTHEYLKTSDFDYDTPSTNGDDVLNQYTTQVTSVGARKRSG